jgi:4-amino-4-deoxy-L-arabinose transferase-like glycosyltransferase
MTTIDFYTQVVQEQGRKLRVSIDAILFLMLLVLIFATRVTNIRYNTLFVDEAIYATIGKNVLSGVLDQNATTWMYGSYLYPVLAAAADYMGGETALRGLSTLLSALASAFVFFATRRLFNKQAGLWAMLIFGLSGVSLALGQYAVYDAPAVCLLAAAFFCLIKAADLSEANETTYLVIAAFCFTLATLSKYLSSLYLLALLCFSLFFYLWRGRPVFPLFSEFLIPATLPLGLYAFFYRYDLIMLFSGDYGVRPGTLWAIIQAIWSELGLVLLLALAGCCWLVWPARHPATNGPVNRLRLRLIGLMPLLVMALLAAPLYHLIAANLHAAWKHTVFSLIFLSPLAGYGCAATIDYVHQRQGRWAALYRLGGLVITVVGLSWYINYSLERNWYFQHQWPNVSRVVDYLQQQGLTADQQVLAEGAQIYEYYFDFGAAHRAMWHDTWYLNYGGRQGTEAMTAAILDRQFDFVVLDGYYTPEIRHDLTMALRQAGYTVDYEEVQRLHSGENVVIQVYTSPNLAETERNAKG